MIPHRKVFGLHGLIVHGVAGVMLVAILLACAPKGPKGLDKDRLDDAVGSAIGDAGTCALLVDKASGRTVWRYGTHMICDRVLPACTSAGTQSLPQLAAVAAKGGAGTAGCDSVPDGSRTVGWAFGPAGRPEKGLVYAAVIESDRGLPGREVRLRIEQAFEKAGL